MKKLQLKDLYVGSIVYLRENSPESFGIRAFHFGDVELINNVGITINRDINTYVWVKEY